MSTNDHPWSSAALEAEDTHLVQLPAGVIDALSCKGDLDDARKCTGAALTPYLVSPECLDVWRMSSPQVAAAAVDAGWVARLIVDFGAQRTVGWAGFRGPPDPSGMVEMGCSVDPAYRRRGYAKAALVILLERADALPEVRTVRTRISVDDQVCRRLVSEYGFVDVGEQEDGRGGRVTVFERTLPSHTPPTKAPQGIDATKVVPVEKAAEVFGRRDQPEGHVHPTTSSRVRQRLAAFARKLTRR